MQNILRRNASFKGDEAPDNSDIIPFPQSEWSDFERALARAAVTILRLPPDQLRRVCFAARVARYPSASAAFGRVPVPHSMGAAAIGIYLARRVAEALKGDWHGDHGLAPGPGHSKINRSLHISPHETDPDDVVLHSYAGDDWKAIKDELRRPPQSLMDRWFENIKQHLSAAQLKAKANREAIGRPGVKKGEPWSPSRRARSKARAKPSLPDHGASQG